MARVRYIFSKNVPDSCLSLYDVQCTYIHKKLIMINLNEEKNMFLRWGLNPHHLKDQSLKFSQKNIENWWSWKSQFLWVDHFEFFYLLHPYSYQSQFMWYQEWDKILMITLISSKKLRVCNNMGNTVLWSFCWKLDRNPPRPVPSKFLENNGLLNYWPTTEYIAFASLKLSKVEKWESTKVKFSADYTKTHSLPSKISPFRRKTISKVGNQD